MSRAWFYSFILIKNPHETTLQRLKNSSKLNKITFTVIYYPYPCYPVDLHKCCIYLDELMVTNATGVDKSGAKRKAVKQLVEYMEQHFPMLEVLHPHSIKCIAKKQEGEPTEDFLNREFCRFALDPTMDGMDFKNLKAEEQVALQELAFRNGFQSRANDDEGGGMDVSITRRRNIQDIYLYVDGQSDHGKYRVLQ